jgi:histidinol dehydrogenase
MKIVQTFGKSKEEAAALLNTLEQRGAVSTAKVEPVVREILAEVRVKGDVALRAYTAKFDGLKPGVALLVSQEEMKEAWKATAPALKKAMRLAQTNIRKFAQRQRPKEWTRTSKGVTTGQIIRPLGSVGCYVPGGRYPLPSTLLMTVTPAQVAGVERIVVCSPASATRGNQPARETMAASYLAGVTEFYRVGGAQAIAAMAYGTESIAAVNKIVGPGNLYVTAAKQMVQDAVGIDMPAGPTEIIVTSEKGSAAGIGADLVAQAEHDPEALAILITSNAKLAAAVSADVDARMKKNDLAAQSIAGQGVIFVTKTVDEARELTNRLAPEHLTVDSHKDLKWVRNAGSVFVGDYAPQSMGDYVSGPNHVLPTGRVGRVRGGLSVMDFLKVITVQEYTRKALREVGPHTVALAEAEGLKGHAESVRVRMR